ncbi:MAG TPA: DUF1385 domain-containing protein [bacterium]|nr:DUF1385 domain-containing protein [bacterium]
MADPKMLIGGQAVLEGVMMRSPRWTSTAVRLPSGEIASFPSRFDSLLLRRRWLRAPVVRGAIVLYEALVIGVRALFQSANAALSEEEALSPQQVTLSVVAGLGLAVGLFFVLPTVVARYLDPYLASVWTLNLAEGGLRVAILIGYIAAIGRMPDIGRVFAYHGAEHKAVNAHEAGVPLDVPNVRAHSRFHPRCGTSFLLIVMIVAVLVFSFLGRPGLLLRVASRVALIPLVAGVSYEIIRAGARYRLFRPLITPGLWLQRLTTREPGEGEIEVAVRALRDVLEREQEPVPVGAAAERVP